MTTHATTTLDRADARMLEAAIRADRPAWPGPHRCDDEAVEVGTGPDHRGTVHVSTVCDLCGRVLGTVRDSVL